LKNHGFLYIYTFNGLNVWGLDHHAAISNWKRYDLSRLKQNIATLSYYLSGYQFDFDTINMPHDGGILKVPIDG
jgi:hypothetical protein